jgi:TPR repeat protein
LAQFNLAVIMLVQGLGTAPRPKEGIVWLRKAAEGGLPRAQYVLGGFFERGEHVAKSMLQATAWYREAAERGWRDAQVALATQYFLGRGCGSEWIGSGEVVRTRRGAG